MAKALLGYSTGTDPEWFTASPRRIASSASASPTSKT